MLDRLVNVILLLAYVHYFEEKNIKEAYVVTMVSVPPPPSTFEHLNQSL
jgi:hypothetical protein